MFVFRKFWRALLSLNTRFEIRSFALFPRKDRLQISLLILSKVKQINKLLFLKKSSGNLVWTRFLSTETTTVVVPCFFMQVSVENVEVFNYI